MKRFSSAEFLAKADVYHGEVQDMLRQAAEDAKRLEYILKNSHLHMNGIDGDSAWLFSIAKLDAPTLPRRKVHTTMLAAIDAAIEASK